MIEPNSFHRRDSWGFSRIQCHVSTAHFSSVLHSERLWSRSLFLMFYISHLQTKDFSALRSCSYSRYCSSNQVSNSIKIFTLTLDFPPTCRVTTCWQLMAHFTTFDFPWQPTGTPCFCFLAVMHVEWTLLLCPLYWSFWQLLLLLLLLQTSTDT